MALGCAVAATDDVAPWLWPAVFLLAASGLLWLVWRAPAVQVRRMGPPASVRLRAGPAGLEHQVGERLAVWSWDAVLRVVDRPEGVYVMLASGASVFVPARQRRPGLGARLEAWRLGGQPASTSLPSAPEGHDELSLRYRATRADYAAYLLAVEARRRTVWWGVGAGALIVAAAWADRGLDLLTLGAVTLWSLALATSGAARRALRRWTVPWQVARALRDHPERLPSGPVVVGLGASGGWLHSAVGEGRFPWPEVRAVDRTDDAVVLFFGEELGMVLPARALPDGVDLDELVARIAQWRAGEPAAVSPRGEAPEEVPSPFAPPVG